MRNEKFCFNLWGKGWGLGLRREFQLFIWKVIHHILVVKDAMLRRKIDINPSCPLCTEMPETIEHVFGLVQFCATA